MKSACQQRQMCYFPLQFFSFLLVIRFRLLCNIAFLKQHHFTVVHNLDSEHKTILHNSHKEQEYD